MVERKIQPHLELEQTTFFSPDGKGELETPQNLAADYPSITDYLDQQPMWADYYKNLVIKKGRVCLLLNLKEERVAVFDPRNWQVNSSSSLAELELPKRLSGLLIIASAGDLERVGTTLMDTTPALAHQSPVFVFEKMAAGQEAPPEERELILEQAGLVARKVLTRPGRLNTDVNNQNLVLRGRVEKKRHKTVTNLVSNDRPKWQIQWLREICRETNHKCRAGGFKVVDWTEIVTALENTTNPPNTISQLKNGFGIEVSPIDCDCRWKISLNGVVTQTHRCNLDCGTSFTHWHKEESDHESEAL
ncbi:hypothetical protein MUP65_01995, partial [Patescibacteria group bacterium]|nr:hypothetical protein [Patescibacteria group bacterium]